MGYKVVGKSNKRIGQRQRKGRGIDYRGQGVVGSPDVLERKMGIVASLKRKYLSGFGLSI
jgi:hypothetical protein